MPSRPPRICGCGHIVAASTRCACQIKRDNERKEAFDRKRPTARERGYDSKWDQARKAFLGSHPTCVMCGDDAKVVDHIKPHRGDMKLFWSRSNWQPLCTRCHVGRKQSIEKSTPPDRN